jgi:hypothetical protein
MTNGTASREDPGTDGEAPFPYLDWRGWRGFWGLGFAAASHSVTAGGGMPIKCFVASSGSTALEGPQAPTQAQAPKQAQAPESVCLWSN